MNEVERSLNRARDQRRRERRLQANGGFAQFVSSIAVAMYVLSRSGSGAVLVATTTPSSPPELDGDGAELDALVERWYLQVDLEKITAVDFPETPFHQRVRAAANRFLAEKAVVDWIGDANAKGVAPSVADVADPLQTLLAAGRRRGGSVNQGPLSAELGGEVSQKVVSATAPPSRQGDFARRAQDREGYSLCVFPRKANVCICALVRVCM